MTTIDRITTGIYDDGDTIVEVTYMTVIRVFAKTDDDLTEIDNEIVPTIIPVDQARAEAKAIFTTLAWDDSEVRDA